MADRVLFGGDVASFASPGNQTQFPVFIDGALTQPATDLLTAVLNAGVYAPGAAQTQVKIDDFRYFTFYGPPGVSRLWVAKTFVQTGVDGAGRPVFAADAGKGALLLSPGDPSTAYASWDGTKLTQGGQTIPTGGGVSNIAYDTDGVPWIVTGANAARIVVDTDGVPYLAGV